MGKTFVLTFIAEDRPGLVERLSDVVTTRGGNWLESQYTWSFTTGASDTDPPTVDQTIPASGDTNVSVNPRIWAVFSEAMDVGSFSGSGNITLSYFVK